MRDRGKKKEGQRNVLPPQIFNGDDYIGVREKCPKILLYCIANTVFNGDDYIGVREVSQNTFAAFLPL